MLLIKSEIPLFRVRVLEVILRVFYCSKEIQPGETEIRITRAGVEPCVVYLHPDLLLLLLCMDAVAR